MNRRRGGYRALLSGQSFEELVRFVLADAEKKGWGSFTHAGTKGRAVKRGGELHFIAAPSLPDFVGTIAPGIACFFDAKTTSHKSWYARTKAEQGQLAFMRRMAQFGAVCFFLVESQPVEAAYIIPVRSTTMGAGAKFTEPLEPPDGYAFPCSKRETIHYWPLALPKLFPILRVE